MSCFLAGDIGGTKTLLQIFAAGEARVPLLRKSYPSAGYDGLAEIVEDFLCEAKLSPPPCRGRAREGVETLHPCSSNPHPSLPPEKGKGQLGRNDLSEEFELASACFALAGPVAGRRVTLTNLPWEVDADALAARFNIAHVSLVNDFEAVGLGVAALESADLLPLQQGVEHEHGVRIVVGAGTGLGVAWLAWQGEGYAVHPSEGGHMDFAPSDETQYALLQYLQQRHGHVSYERIVSGPGLVTIFEFLRDTKRAAPSAELIAAMQAGDGAAAISRFASEQNEAIATQALEMFTQIYGAFVGNLALAALPRGGIYVAGGIAAKIAAQMQSGGFMRAFLDKGRFHGLLSTLPLSIVANPQIGLLGASLVAQRS